MGDKNVIIDTNEPTKKIRNPDWCRDEIILALELYFSADRGPIDKKNPKIIELSHTLRNLPKLVVPKDESTFRNVNSVATKLGNFQSVDPSYKGKGLSNGSDLDEALFKEFYDDRSRLRDIASEIRKVASNNELKQEINSIEDDDLDIADAIDEGRILYKLHKVRERNRAIVDKKKKQAIKLYGKLICEVCSFVFQDYYGKIGEGFIECHHKLPLSEIKVSAKTKLEDLALVCSNCHRMLHKTINLTTIETLKAMIELQKSTSGIHLF